jgi:TRAP-type C4-dicarboxylate transport system permease small subunit
VTRVESAIVCLAIGVIALTVASNVASRYVLHASTEEVARYMLMWLGMVGGARSSSAANPLRAARPGVFSRERARRATRQRVMAASPPG